MDDLLALIESEGVVLSEENVEATMRAVRSRSFSADLYLTASGIYLFKRSPASGTILFSNRVIKNLQHIDEQQFIRNVTITGRSLVITFPLMGNMMIMFLMPDGSLTIGVRDPASWKEKIATHLLHRSG